MTINLDDYAVGVDIWGGGGDIGEVELKAGGCEFAILRLNQSDGSLNMDSWFERNWPQAANMARAAYVVINPYIGRTAYTAWIRANLPADCEVVAMDVEISGGTALSSSRLVTGVLDDLAAVGLRVMLYSGAWFYNLVNPWPSQFDQWWARYPYSLYPDPPERITWDQMRAKLSVLEGYYPLGSYQMQPGHVAIWQCTSRYILPGGPPNWPIDVNLMPRADFNKIFLTVTPPPLTWEQSIDAWARQQPNPYTGPKPA